MVDISSPRAGRERLASRPPASATDSPVPARDDENSAPALGIPAPREERSGGSRTGMLDHQSCPVEVGLGRLLDRGIIDRDDLVDEFSDMLEGQVTWPDHSEPIGDGLPASDRRRLPLLERSLHRRGIGWLDADHLTIGRSEEHTSELQSRGHLVCRLLLEKKKKFKILRKRFK